MRRTGTSAVRGVAAPRAVTVTVALALTLAGLLAGCGPTSPEVVVYASVDQVYAEPILEAYERASGVRVRAVYDAEAAKTTGLVQRLIAEGKRPRADVFWSGEPVQTMKLADEGVLATYRSPVASEIPTAFVDPTGRWTGFGGRARILLVNSRVPADSVPSRVSDLASTTWPAARVGMSLPIFGTGATHAAALYALDGPDTARSFYRTLAKRGIKVYDGNGAVRDAVVAGTLDWGLTDTDDGLAAIRDGAKVRIVIPDQGVGGRGALVIPNTVALVRGAPNEEEGRRLIDHLLSAETERELVKSGWIQFPVRGVPDAAVASSAPEPMRVDLTSAYEMLGRAEADLREVFVR